MAQFRYKAQSLDGKKNSGIIYAADTTELQMKLRAEGLLLLSAKEVQKRKKVRPLKAKVLADFSRQLSTLVASGVTLVRALNIIAKGDAVKPREREIYNHMLARIRQGVALSDAMEEEEGVFPPLMIYMFRSAESGGNLDQVAMKMADLYEKDHKMNAKISSSMTYPKILSVLIVGVIFVLMNYVMPQFEDLFSQMETLPLATRVLNHISTFIQGYWYLLLLGFLLLWAGVKAVLQVPTARLWWHKITLHIPVFGKLQKVICTARFARTLSSLYAAGVPIISALQISRKTVGNDYIDKQFDQVIAFLRAGNNLSEGLDIVDGFVRKLSDAIRVGEETGSLDSMLISTAEAMEYDSDMAINKMVSYVEPVMLLIMGVIVAFVMVAVFGALYGSYDVMGSVG